MRHISQGSLRAFHDKALNPADQAQVREHLRTCRRCAERAARLAARTERVEGLFSHLEPEAGEAPVSSLLAYRRLTARQDDRKEREMTRNLVSRRYRPAWAVAALALLTVVTLTVAPVRTLAGNLLGVFRVQRIALTPVDSTAFPDEERLEALAPEIDRMFGDTLAIIAESGPERLSEGAARERADFSIRLPRTTFYTRHEWVAPIHVEMAIDVQSMQALFIELGYRDIRLPRDLDGRRLEADFSGMLTTYYGTCDDEPIGQDCITLVQMASPTVAVPDGLDVERLGRIYLELLGTPAEDALQLSKQIDWTTTLVLPFPHHVNLTYESLPVDGVEATLVHSKSGYRPTAEYLLTWVKEGVIYAVAGKGDYSEALTLVGSMP